MSLSRRIARPLLSSIFLYAGAEALRDPEPRAKKGERVATKVAATVGLPQDPVTLVRLNAGVQVGAGTMLALGKLPRLSALVLAGSLVVTTIGGHAFWEEPDPTTKTAQRIQFCKNMSILGGLLLAAADRPRKVSPRPPRRP
jgi:uncharacterized membrane protein YphA (DoxX/SURF4 family)